MTQLEVEGLTGRLAFERGERRRFALQILQLKRDNGLEAVYIQGGPKNGTPILFLR